MIRGREDDEGRFVEFVIRKRDQAVMAGSVVPAQPPYRLKQRARDIKNALPYTTLLRALVTSFIVGIDGYALEETGGRKLFRIAHDDDLSPSGERADGVFRLELGGFVHHDEIESELAGRQVLGYGQRPHHEARLERHQRISGALDQLADRNVALLFVDFIRDQRHLGPGPHGAALISIGDRALIDNRRSKERRVGKECRSRWSP